MAGASSKRIAQANAATLKQLNLGFAISGAIYLLHLAVFSSGRSYRRLFLFAATEAIAIGLWNMMKSMAARGEELNGSKGLVSYMFDVIYITWGVHVAAALLTTKAWYIYWVIPLYALYRLVTVFLPTLRSLAGSAGASTAGAGAGGAGGAGANEPLSKRQEKLRKRMERGDPRVQQRTR
ncbi:Snd2p [Rhodotorula paludigena]|uniref:Snd2p n=1 Tax=Rhodotorula paludigena TaxID=86838 RepID=UPI00317A75D5